MYSNTANTAKQINTEFGLVIFTELLNKTPTHTKKVRLFDDTPTSQEYFYLFQKNRLPFPHVHNYSSGETYTAITAYQKAFNLTIKDAFIALCNKYINSINSTFAPANTPKYTPATATQVTQVIPNNPLQVDIKDFGTSISNSHKSNFVSFLNKNFPTDIVKQVIQMYNVGTRVFDSSNNTYWNNFDTAFWYSDINNKVLNAKYFIYDENNAKRSKTVNPNWYHAQKRKDKPKIGFFGEHLSIKNKTIWVVESEKSAIILAIHLIMNNSNDKVVWACGGQNSLLATFERCSVSKQELQSQKIMLVPDTDTHHTSFNKWLEYVDRLNSEGFNVSITEYLENTCTTLQKELKFDIADLLISDLEFETPATPTTNDIPAIPATNDIPAIPAIPATNEVTELHYKSYENLFLCFNTDNLGVLGVLGVCVKIYVNETKKFHKNELELFFRSFDFGRKSVEFEIFEVFDVFEELEKVTNIIKPQIRHN